MQPADLALVTGASGGIGADIARVLARRGLRVALVARSKERLEQLSAELATSGPAPLVFAIDLSKPEGPEAVQCAIATAGARVSLLVNNAGFGLVGRACDLDRAEQVEMVNLNVRALVDLTVRFAPDLIASRGRILNVASVAAFSPGPGMAVYFATKAFVLSFSEALSEEFKQSGVTVTALCPGLTPTGFQARAGMAPRFGRLVPSTPSTQVAEVGVAALFSGRRRVVPGASNRMFTRLAPFIPRALALPALLRAQQTKFKG